MKALVRILGWGLLLVAVPGRSAWGQPNAVDFTREVQPILAKHCYQCHGPGDAESG